MLAGLNRRRAICATGIGLLAALVAGSCDKVPLFAPTESTITLTASRLALAANDTAEVAATVIEQSGTPAQNGTAVTFTTTLGTIEPREALTNGGTATVLLRAGTQSGTATVGAFSGGTRADDITILIGVTQTVILNVTPRSQPFVGGDVDVIAVVHDANGNPLQGISVVFTADAGVLSPPTAVTDGTGEASTTLTTTQETIVTADAGGQRASATVLNATGPVATFTAIPVGNLKVDFLASTSTGTSLTYIWNFGDSNTGSGVSLSHTYAAATTYTVRLTVVDSNDLSDTTTLSVTVT